MDVETIDLVFREVRAGVGHYGDLAPDDVGRVLLALALLIGADQKWLSTGGFLDKIDENLKKAMA